MLRITPVAPSRGSEINFAERHYGRRRATAVAVSLVFATAGAVTATDARSAATHVGTRHLSQVRPVSNCDDDSPGSLRAVINSNQTVSGDIVDLSQLSCGRITLSTGAITVPQADLTLVGPGKESLVITADNASRLLDHTSGTLSLEQLSLTSGTYEAVGGARGGCVRSTGSVYLLDASIDDCHASSDTGVASGGAISAANVTLVLSSVSNSSATSASNNAYGGAVAAMQTVLAKYSATSGNSVHDGAGSTGGGGAIAAGFYALITNTTIDHNEAPCSSAVVVIGSANIKNSTMSDNHSGQCAAVAIAGPSAYIANSTIAFNRADTGSQAGLYFRGTNLSSGLTLQSSIVANNTAGAANSAADLYAESAFLEGFDNLVMSINGVPPAGFVAVATDPELGPLQWNGGLTKTRALQAASPGIGMGNNLAGATNDQRGVGYPRTTGTSSSVDIGAFQFDSIFADAFEL